MGELNYSPRRVTRTLENKLGVAFEDGSERVGWYEVDGIKRVQFRIPKVHSSWGIGVVADVVRKSRLTKPEFRRLVACPMSGAMYDDILRQRLHQ